MAEIITSNLGFLPEGMGSGGAAQGATPAAELPTVVKDWPAAVSIVPWAAPPAPYPPAGTLDLM